MKFKAEIDIMPQKALLDPQGKAVSRLSEKCRFAPN
jgi:phosphoribosylformylglycinamidine (FGAM) synthase PurS component